MPLINYSLRHPREIHPWGTEPDTNIHWFGLTDGHYWLSVGDKTLFECTESIRQQWSLNGPPYVDYFIVRLLDDLSYIFKAIAEPIPEEFYRIARSYDSLYDFYRKASAWLDQFPDTERADIDLYYDKYNKVVEWIDTRSLSTMHLNLGPKIHFFRCADKLSIVWKTADREENGIRVWTAGNGEIEMPYSQFVRELKDFGERFFHSMEDQLEKAFQRDWGTTKIDPDQIRKEQQARKAEFDRNTDKLLEKCQTTTDWSLVMGLVREMSSGSA